MTMWPLVSLAPRRACYHLTMKRETVLSSAIRAVGFDPQSQTLEVEFTNGRVYRYFDVPEFLHRGFMVAQSKGTGSRQEPASVPPLPNDAGLNEPIKGFWGTE
jgi:hypothetical protein